MSEIKINGPFGNYPVKGLGGVLNALCAEGVPLHVVESVTLGEKHGEYMLVKQGSDEFARYKYFEGIDLPLFYFQGKSYGHQEVMWNDKDELVPKLKLSMYLHGTASLVVRVDRDGDVFTNELYQFISEIMFSNISHVSEISPDWMIKNNTQYKLRQAAGAFFQGGSGGPEKEWLYIEFALPQGAQAFVDYINNNFVYKGRVKPPLMMMGD